MARLPRVHQIGKGLLGVGLIAGVLSGCNGGLPKAVRHGPTTVAGLPTTSPANVQPVGIKAAIAGLLDRQGPPSAGAPVQAFVINANWSDIQPRGPNDLLTSAIDSQLAVAAKDKLAVKLRLFAGINAPAWLKAQTGPAISVTEPVSGHAGTIGRYWTPGYAQAYDSLMAKLASRYDQVPDLREVTVSRCSTVFSETFLRNARDPTSLSALLAAGLTADLDKACIREEIDAQQVWHLTRTGVAFNPFQEVQPGGSARVDEAFTEETMDYCRLILGSRCVLENNSLRSPPLPEYTEMYDHMRHLGKPTGFQTAALPRLGDLTATLQLAVSLGASQVELPAGYDPAAITSSAVSLLRSNAAN